MCSQCPHVSHPRLHLLNIQRLYATTQRKSLLLLSPFWFRELPLFLLLIFFWNKYLKLGGKTILMYIDSAVEAEPAAEPFTTHPHIAHPAVGLSESCLLNGYARQLLSAPRAAKDDDSLFTVICQGYPARGQRILDLIRPCQLATLSPFAFESRLHFSLPRN